jgi:hypothetical protein
VYSAFLVCLSLPEIARKASARFFRGCGSTSFHVRISFATSLLRDYSIKIQLHTRICLVDMSHSLPILDITAMASPALRKDAIPVTVEHASSLRSLIHSKSNFLWYYRVMQFNLIS